MVRGYPSDYEEHSAKLVAEGKLDELMNDNLPQVFGMLEDASGTENMWCQPL